MDGGAEMYNKTYHGLGKWFGHTKHMVGSLAAMEPGHPHYDDFVKHIKDSLEHLAEAINERCESAAGDDQARKYDLKIHLKHITQLQKSVDVLAPGAGAVAETSAVAETAAETVAEGGAKKAKKSSSKKAPKKK